MHTAFRVCVIGVLVCALPLVLVFYGGLVASFADSFKRFIKQPNLDDFVCMWMNVGLLLATAAGVFAWLDKEVA